MVTLHGYVVIPECLLSEDTLRMGCKIARFAAHMLHHSSS